MQYTKYNDKITIHLNDINLYTKLMNTLNEFSRRFRITYVLTDTHCRAFDIILYIGEYEVLLEHTEPYQELEVKFKIKDYYSLFDSDDYILNISEKDGKFRMNLSVSYVFEFIKD